MIAYQPNNLSTHIFANIASLQIPNISTKINLNTAFLLTYNKCTKPIKSLYIYKEKNLKQEIKLFKN